VIRKLSALWNKQQRSTKASDAIQETLNGLFVTDVATRWNSTFRALERVHRFVKEDSAKFLSLYTTLNLTTGKDRVVPPTPREISFIGEYIQVIHLLGSSFQLKIKYITMRRSRFFHQTILLIRVVELEF
jgi:hypothetical protein